MLSHYQKTYKDIFMSFLKYKQVARREFFVAFNQITTTNR
jgi:hypothetical protein